MRNILLGFLIGTGLSACFHGVTLQAGGNMTCYHEDYTEAVFSGAISLVGQIVNAPGIDLDGTYYLCNNNKIQCDVALDEEE